MYSVLFSHNSTADRIWQAVCGTYCTAIVTQSASKWSPRYHSFFPAKYRTMIEAVLLTYKRRESPLHRLPFDLLQVIVGFVGFKSFSNSSSRQLFATEKCISQAYHNTYRFVKDGPLESMSSTNLTEPQVFSFSSKMIDQLFNGTCTERERGSMPQRERETTPKFRLSSTP